MAGEVPLVGVCNEQNDRKGNDGRVQPRLTSGEKGRRWCHMFVRISCQFLSGVGVGPGGPWPDSSEWPRLDLWCLNDNEDICRNSGHQLRPTGPYSDIWKQMSRDQKARALTRPSLGEELSPGAGGTGGAGGAGGAGRKSPVSYDQVPTGLCVSQSSRVCYQQQVPLNPPLPSPRVTPRLNTDAGAVPPVWTCVSVVQV